MEKKAVFGLSQNLASLLCYAGIFFTGIFFFIVERENKVVRFHAIQSMILFGFLSLISAMVAFLFGWIFLLGNLIQAAFFLIFFVIWLVMMGSAITGFIIRLPFIGVRIWNHLHDE